MIVVTGNVLCLLIYVKVYIIVGRYRVHLVLTDV